MTVNHDVVGSSPTGGVVKKKRFKTPPFHGGNTGSNPVRTMGMSQGMKKVKKVSKKC